MVFDKQYSNHLSEIWVSSLASFWFYIKSSNHMLLLDLDIAPVTTI